MAATLALGQTPTSQESAGLGEEAMLPRPGQRAWTFASKTKERTPDGQPIWKRLVYTGETPIRRHIKIRPAANPFDPQWKSYFAERAFQKKFGLHRHEAGIKPS